MRKKFLILFFSCSYTLALIFCEGVQGQVKFYAEADSKLIGKSDYVQLLFTVKNAPSVEQIIPPSFTNFNIISGPSQKSGMTINNGNMDQYISVSYFLQPKKAGKFKIGSAIAIIGGQNYHSKPIEIQVTNNPTNKNHSSLNLPFGFNDASANSLHEYDDYILRKGENVPEKIRDNLFVKLEVSKTSCFVGESFIATYKLYSRLKSESNITKTPSFNGFSVNEIGKVDSYNLTTEKINGRDYNVYILRKVELYPLQPGRIELEPLQVENKITFIQNDKVSGMDNIQNLLQSLAKGMEDADRLIQQTVTLKNKPQFINVKPLPIANIGDSFKGAVGKFTIKDSLEKQSVFLEDGGKLVVKIKGEGNIQMINSPTIKWPKGIEGFEPITSEKINKISAPINGERCFIYPFSIIKAGVYNIPAIPFIYFDNKQNKYITVKTDPLLLTVKEGYTNNLIVNSKKENKSHSTKSMWIVIGSVIITCFTWILFRNEKNKKIGENLKKSNITIHSYDQNVSLPLKPLGNLESLLAEKDSKLFYTTFKSDLKNYLSTKLKFSKSDLTRKIINELLDQNNVGTGTTVMLNTLLDDIDKHLYAANTPDLQMKEAYEKGIEIIQLIEKQIS